MKFNPARGRHILARLTIDNATMPRTLRVDGSDQETAHLYIYDVIDSYWGTSATDVISALKSIESNKVRMHINSPGGDVFEARAIVSAMRNSGKDITTVVDGLAASSASWIATAGNRAEIMQGAFLMIHNSWAFEMGNSEELRKTADLLDRIDSSIVDEYMKRSNQDRDQVVQWLNDETWFDADESVQFGFADAIADAETAGDGGPENAAWNLSAYNRVPEQLLRPSSTLLPNNNDRDWESRQRRVELLNLTKDER